MGEYDPCGTKGQLNTKIGEPLAHHSPTSEGKQESGRAQRKAGLKPMPRGLAKQPTRQQKQEVDNSPAAVIARMRQARAVN